MGNNGKLHIIDNRYNAYIWFTISELYDYLYVQSSFAFYY